MESLAKVTMTGGGRRKGISILPSHFDLEQRRLFFFVQMPDNLSQRSSGQSPKNPSFGSDFIFFISSADWINLLAEEALFQTGRLSYLLFSATPAKLDHMLPAFRCNHQLIRSNRVDCGKKC